MRALWALAAGMLVLRLALPQVDTGPAVVLACLVAWACLQ
jgi:hypothetical protein